MATKSSAEGGHEGFTSREVASVSGVPFFTVDYWDRSKFLKPSIARSTGRGRGRGRLYSYSDALRLRIARELREQHVSLLTLRYVVKRLGERADALVHARWVFVGKKIELATNFGDLVKILKARGNSFGFFLDLSEIQRGVGDRARKVRTPGRSPVGASLTRD